MVRIIIVDFNNIMDIILYGINQYKLQIMIHNLNYIFYNFLMMYLNKDYLIKFGLIKQV